MFREHRRLGDNAAPGADDIRDDRTPAHSVDVKADAGSQGLRAAVRETDRPCTLASPNRSSRSKQPIASTSSCKRLPHGAVTASRASMTRATFRARTPHEITFFAPCRRRRTALRLDGPEGLRAEHHETVHHARANGRRIGGEPHGASRVAAEDASSRVVLASLFGVVYAVGRIGARRDRRLHRGQPAARRLLSRALGFTIASDARFCERVRAPLVPHFLDVEMLDEQLGLPARDAAEEPLTALRHLTAESAASNCRTPGRRRVRRSVPAYWPSPLPGEPPLLGSAASTGPCDSPVYCGHRKTFRTAV